MSETTVQRTRCLKCGFETAAGTDDWDRVDLPSLGSITQCPECGSTNVTMLG